MAGTVYLNGQKISASAEIIYGKPEKHEKKISIDDKVKKEVRGLETEENFVALYPNLEWIFNAENENNLFFLSLVGSNSLVCGNQRGYKVVSKIYIYGKKDGKYINLWKQPRFDRNMRPVFLNLASLKSTIENFIGVATIEKGILSYRSSKTAAWQIRSEKGVFYIPWHNGAVIEAKSDSILSFWPATIKEMNSCYCALRFKEERLNEFSILLC